MAKGKGGFIGQDGLNAPDPATGVSGAAGEAQVTVSFTAPTDVGGSAITGYRVQSNDGIGASGSASPITVSGLTNGTSYTFNVWAINPFGWSSPSDASAGIAPVAAPRSLFASTGIIDYVQVDTTGNATDFGDLHANGQGGGSGSSTTRALFFGWDNDTRTRIDTVEISTTGNATDFGDMSNPRRYNAALSNNTRTVWGTGDDDTDSVVMEYSTIASAGNAADFGDATVFAYSNTGTASPTRGIFAAGQTTGSTSSVINTMMYVTIGSTGNATDFGDLTLARRTPGGVSNGTRAVFGGGRDSGNSNTNVMDYVTIASTGNATDFGDLAIGGFGNNEGSGSSTRGIFGPGFGSGSPYVGIAYITIASTGNSTTFGDLTGSNRYNSMSASNAHGGLS